MQWEARTKNDVSVTANAKESGSQGINVGLWFCAANSDLLSGHQRLKVLCYECVLRKDSFESAISSLPGFSLMLRLHVELWLLRFLPS